MAKADFRKNIGIRDLLKLLWFADIVIQNGYINEHILAEYIYDEKQLL